MALVVDASIALAWGLPDESSTYAAAVLAVVEREGLRVPSLWPREIANGLAVAYRRGRITSADERAFLSALAHLYIAAKIPETTHSSELYFVFDVLWTNGMENTGNTLMERRAVLENRQTSGRYSAGEFCRG
jgi:hypothetical protein